MVLCECVWWYYYNTRPQGPHMSAPAADFDPAAFVKDLTDEQKEAVFYAILKEVLADATEYETMPLSEDDGPTLAYLLTTKEYDTLREKYGFPLYRDATEEMAKRIPRSERDWLTLEESLAEMDAEDTQLDEATPPPSTGERAAAER